MKLFDDLAAGKLPSMDVNTSVESKSLVNIGLIIFITACLIFLAFYTFKKVSK